MINYELTNSMKVQYAARALAAYQNEMVKIWGEKYDQSLSALKQFLNERNPDFMVDFGKAVSIAGIGERRLHEAMERTALKSKDGKIPLDSAFYQGLADELSDFDWSLLGDSALDVARDLSTSVTETANEVGGGLKKFGSFIGNNLTMIVVIVLAILSLGGFMFLRGKA